MSKIEEWAVLGPLLGNEKFYVSEVSLVDREIRIRGAFELPPLARLSHSDQVFVAAFVRCHGSIKEMETLYGVSYPTIKARLQKLEKEFSEDFLEIRREEDDPRPAPVSARGRDRRLDIIDRLERGEITADEAARLFREKENKQ